MTTGRGHPIRDVPHGLISGFNARAMSKDNEAGHTWMSDGALDELDGLAGKIPRR